MSDAKPCPTCGEVVHEGWKHIGCEDTMSDKAAEATETDPKHDPTPRAPRDWRTMSIVEIAAENPSVMDYITHWEGRALKAEALVAEFKRRGEINE